MKKNFFFIIITVIFYGLTLTSCQTNKADKTPGTLEIIHSRKSVRQYTDQKVSREQLETLVRAGMAAPTAMNRQEWAFIAIDDKITLDQLKTQMPNNKGLQTAQAAITVCGNMHKAGNDAGQQFWIQSCSAAAQNILLAAEAIGLGAVWTAAYPDTKRVNIIQNALNLPEHIIPLCLIPVGYPAQKDQPKNKWKPENMRWNKW